MLYLKMRRIMWLYLRLMLLLDMRMMRKDGLGRNDGLGRVLGCINVLLNLLIKIIIFIILVTLLLFNFLSWIFLDDVQIALFIIVVRYWPLKPMRFERKYLSANLKTNAASFGADDQVAFYKNQSPEFGFIVFNQELTIFIVIYKICMMPRNRNILGKLDIDIFFSTYW